MTGCDEAACDELGSRKSPCQAAMAGFQIFGIILTDVIWLRWPREQRDGGHSACWLMALPLLDAVRCEEHVSSREESLASSQHNFVILTAFVTTGT